MIENVVKRNGEKVSFDIEKIENAIRKSMISLGDEFVDEKNITKSAKKVVSKLKSWDVNVPSVDQIHVLVENSLMDLKLYEVAREYITYRDQHKPDIFRKRTEIKPYEYPQLLDYVDAIRHSYWIHTEFNYDSDIQDMKVLMNEKEISAVTRAMLAISQIESAVKTFWGKIHDRLPKPEIAKVGATFAESEVRHEDAYSNLIEIMGLNDEFKNLIEVPCMKKRIKYLELANRNIKSNDPRDYFETIILFSMFIENVSLFSQFLILMSFEKHENYLKGISNAIEATSKEENIHAEFGFDIVNIIKEENPDWFDDELIEYIKEIAYKAFEAEKEIVDWIYEKGDLEIIPKKITIEYIKSRLNRSLESIGIEKIFGIDPELLEQTNWFDDEVSVTKNNDAFNKRNTTYTKRSQAFTADDLF